MNLSDILLSDCVKACSCIPGITTGIVKENWDEKNPGMVKVEMLLGEEGKNVTGLARVMSNYGGNGYGNYCLPEIGQKVVVAFHFGERDCPVVLGTLWDEKNVLPENTANEENTIKSFTTYGGCSLIFSDEKDKQKIEAATPGGLFLSLDDEGKTISLRDEKGDNIIEADCENGSITLKAKTKIELKIGDDTAISIEKDSLKLKSSEIRQTGDSKISLEGQNINISAKTNLDASANSQAALKANAGMKLESSALMEIKGAMVKLN